MSKLLTKAALIYVLLVVPYNATLAGTPLKNGYYIVVAAYLSNQEEFAQKYSTELNQAGNHAQVGFDASRNFFYVYLDYFTDFDESINKMLEVRKQAGFAEAWVRVIKDGTETIAAAAPQEPEPAGPKEKESPKATSKKTESVQSPSAAVVKPETPAKPEPAPKEEPAAAPLASTPAPATEVVPNPKADPVYVPQTLKNTQVFFSLYNATNNQSVDGEVEVIDAERSRLLLKAKANEYITLPDPKSTSGKLLLIGSSFGYRKVQNEINYNETEKDTLQPNISLVGNYYMVRFEMVRLHKGDIAVLYNVYFYNDAAIMLSDSKYELNKILTMMNENPKYKIILHGHTNGNGRGKIMKVGPSKDFFNLRADDIVTDNVSAKELSGARAQVIKDWLVSQGVAAERVAVKAWGGSRMLYDKNSQNARKNVRVEIEIEEE
jgi:outer membrane protein OmpA-like peptidoglycan-associated protein